MTDTPPSKTQLRATLRQRRASLPSSAQHAAAQALTHTVVGLPAWKAAHRIALYLAADGEISTRPLESTARKLGKLLFLPLIKDDNSLRFACWGAQDALSNNRYNIPEPPASAGVCPVSNLDIIFLPLVGWDLRGGRLGMGGGFAWRGRRIARRARC